jgi:hypothetical protein
MSIEKFKEEDCRKLLGRRKYLRASLILRLSDKSVSSAEVI